MVSELAQKRCIPCEGGVPPLKEDEINQLMAKLEGGWKVIDNHDIEKEYSFPDFKQALAFVNRVGGKAEEEGHHPDIYLAWGKVKVTLWTHAIDGLTESDFIFAAKADEVL